MPSPEQLRALVEAFYTRARADALLGPVFEQAVADWPHHFAALTRFWQAATRPGGRYRGMPLAAHRALGPTLKPEMFARWLELWDEVTKACLPAEAGAAMRARARHYAARLDAALFPPGDDAGGVGV